MMSELISIILLFSSVILSLILWIIMLFVFASKDDDVIYSSFPPIQLVSLWRIARKEENKRKRPLYFLLFWSQIILIPIVIVVGLFFIAK